MGERDRGVAGSPTGTGSLGRPGKRAGPGAGLDPNRPGRGYPWGGAARSPERRGSRGEEPGCGVGMDGVGGWVGASSLPPRRRPRLSRAQTRVVSPPPPRAALRGAAAPRFRCKARSCGSPRTARNEGGAGHSVPRRPAEPRETHRTSARWGSGDAAAEGRIWGQMGGKGGCRGGTRLCRAGAGAVPESALSPGTLGPVWGRPGPAEAEGVRGRTAPPRPRVRGAPKQLLPLTSGARRAARARAQLLLPVARPGAGGLRGGAPQRRGPRATGSPCPLRQLEELPRRAGNGPARRCLVPRRRGGSVPLLLPGQDPYERPQLQPRLAHGPGDPAGPPRSGGRSPLLSPRRSRLRLAFSLPPRTATGDPTPAPRGSRRGTESFPPLVPAQEAAAATASPLSALTRGCGAPRSRVAPRRRRGRSGCSAGSTAAPPCRVGAGRGSAPGPCFPPAPGATAAEVRGKHPVARAAAAPRPRGWASQRRRGRCPGSPGQRREAGAAAPSGPGGRSAPPRPSPAPPGRALHPLPTRLSSTRHLPESGIRAAASAPIQEPRPPPALINND